MGEICSSYQCRSFSNWQNRVPNMFSIIESKPHSVRKRMISHIYSKSSVQSSPDLDKISQVMIFGRLLPLLARVAINKQPLDVLEINHASAIDFITAFIFGLQNGTNFILDSSTRRDWFKIYQQRHSSKSISSSLFSRSSIFLGVISIDTSEKGLT